MVTGRIHRFALRLMSFNFAMEYRPGKSHGNADFLSRAPTGTSSSTDAPVFTIPPSVGPISMADVKRETLNDSGLQDVLHWITADEELPCPSPDFKNKKSQLSCEDGVLLWGQRVVVPRPLRSRMLSSLHQFYQGSPSMKSLARL